jgi:hypothetical protein
VNALAVSNGLAYFAPYTIDESGQRHSRVEVIDLHDRADPRLLGAYSTTGVVFSFSLIDHYVYAGRFSYYPTYLGGVDILDVTDPSNPARVGGITTASAYSQWPTDYSPMITVAGGLACLGTAAGIMSFDVSEPTVMRPLGSLVVDVGARDVAVSGSYAFVADYYKGLAVLDASDPANLRTIGSVKTPYYVKRVVVSGDYAYVAAHGLHTIDVSDPTRPRRTSTYAEGDDIAVSGNLLYTAGYGAGLHVLDLTWPASPRRIGNHDVRYMYSDQSVAVSGDYAFVTSSEYPSTGIVEVFDVSTPSSPQLVASFDTPGQARAIAVSGNLAVVAGDSGDGTTSHGFVEILGLGGPSWPRWLASYAPDAASSCDTVSIMGHRAFIGCQMYDALGKKGSTGLEVIDLSDPARPRRIGGFNSIGTRLAFSGDYLFASGNGAVNTFLMGTPSFDLAGTLELLGESFGLAVADAHGYVAAGSFGLQVLDLNNPVRPATLGDVYTGGSAWDVAVADHRAYVAAGDAGLVVLDVSNSAAPVQIGGLDTPGDARAVLLSGSMAYVADGGEGVQIFDVSNPTVPRRVGGHGTTGWATGLALHGNDLLVACREAGLMVLDVRDPADPRHAATYNRGGNVMTVAVAGDHAFVSDGLEGFTVLDLANPRVPVAIGTAPGGGYARGIAIAGRFAYVADSQAGVQVYDLADPTKPRRMGGNSALSPYRLVATDGQLYAAGGLRGLGVYDPFTPPLSLEALPADVSGSGSVTVDGPAGTNAQLQRSVDLETWEDWQMVTLENLPKRVAVSNEGTNHFFRLRTP